MKGRGLKGGFFAALLFFLFCVLSLPAAAGERITVAGASDLAFAFKEIAQEFEKDTGVGVVLSLGSTGMLTKQIEHGAPFDAFFAANISYIDGLAEGGYVVPDTVEVYAVGRLVLAVNRASGVEAKGLAGLAGPRIKRVAIANPAHAPYGAAAMEALKSAGLWESVKPKLVYGENIRQTLQFIQTGDAEAGIVALSIADVPEISHTVIDFRLHNRITQAAAVVRGSKNERAARDFIRYVNGPKGRPIMEKYGFT
ncbi:MAG: molybdate ABC transporter substrate-binding protein, partial [Deltaproteobacteria bacterium]|nr:molybdate ABC transporter substrate-binding protein [Deltaproteobacteria bacterium]